MKSFDYYLHQSWFVLPLVFILVFVLSYLHSQKLLMKLQEKTFGQQEKLFKLLDDMFVDIDRTRIKWMIYALSFGLGGAVFLLTWPNFFVGLPLGFAFGLAGWNVPHLIFKSMYEKRCNRFTDQMVDGLTIMANGVKAGLSLTQSMERVVENLGNPIAQEFALVLSQTRLGRTVEEALADLAVRIPRPDVQMLVTSVNILKETGGNLAETFSTIVTVVRERQKVEKKIQAFTAQGLTQGLIITLVPFILMIVFLFIDPSYIMPMFTTTLGLVLVGIMFFLQIIGGLVIKKIVSIKV